MMIALQGKVKDIM